MPAIMLSRRWCLVFLLVTSVATILLWTYFNPLAPSPNREIYLSEEAAPTASNRQSTTLPFGVNVWGYIRGEFGVGEATRGLAAALIAAGIPIVIIDAQYTIQQAPHRMNDHTYDNYTINTNEPKYYFNVVHLNPRQSRLIFQQIYERFARGRYSIGVWWWETETLPESWLKAFALYDEIWAGSRFIHKAIQSSYAHRAPIPSSFFRFPLTHKNFTLLPRSHFNVTTEDFVFFFNFDFFSIVERKNPLAVINAFKRFENRVRSRGEVRHTSVPLLIVKYNNVQGKPEYRPILDQLIAEADGSRIVFLGALSAQETSSIFSHLDCYVSLHRAEGFGLGIAQAMMEGKPCIVTDYSGSRDFATDRTAYLVPWNYTSIHAAPYAENRAMWAEPSIETASELMRRVYLNPSAAKKVGQQAKKLLLKYYSPENCGQNIKEHLNSLWQNRKGIDYYLERKFAQEEEEEEQMR